MIGKKIALLSLVGIFSMSLLAAASSGTLLAQTLPHHFIGVISGLNSDKSAFTLETGSKKLVTVTSTQTKFFNFSGGLRSKSSFSAIKDGQRAAVVGEVQGSTLTAKLVAIIRTNLPKRHAAAGKITAIGGSAISFEPAGKAGTSKSFNVTSSTVYTKKVNGQIERANNSDLSVGDRISFVGTINDAGIITAKLVHVIPAK